MDRLKKIKFLKKLSSVKELSKNQFLVSKGDKFYLVTFSDQRLNLENKSLMNEFKILHTELVETGKVDEIYYSIENALNGGILSNYLCMLSDKDLYEKTFIIGTFYKNIKDKFNEKEMDEKHYSEYLNFCFDVLKQFNLLGDKFDALPKKSKETLIELREYILKNFNVIKNGTLIYTHNNINFNSFLLQPRTDLISFCSDNIDYVEPSFALKNCFVNYPTIDELRKSAAYVSGYLEGIYQFNIPKNVLDSFNLMFALMAIKVSVELINNNQLENLQNHLQNVETYFDGNKVTLNNRLTTFTLDEIPLLKNAKFKLVKGSYNNHNLVYRVTTPKKEYFLKVMYGDKKTLEKYNYYYNIVKTCKISAPKMIQSGHLKNGKCIFTLMEFVGGGQYNVVHDRNSIKEGEICGRFVAKELKKLEKAPIQKEFLPTVTIDDLYKSLVDMADNVYNSEYKKHMPCSKEKVMELANRLKSGFDNEPIVLIHGDIKMENVLDDGKKVYIADNENYYYTYQIVNFRYNLAYMYREGASNIKKGFVKAYLKEIYGEEVPERVHNQIKFLILLDMVIRGNEMLYKRGGFTLIPAHTKLINSNFYNEPIAWLI